MNARYQSRVPGPRSCPGSLIKDLPVRGRDCVAGEPPVEC